MSIQTIAVFRVHPSGAAWCCSDGMASTLRSMGYRVLDCGDPRLTNVPIEDLQQVELIVMNAVEWYDEVLANRYGLQAWHALKAPKAAWYAESAHRDDRSFPFERCRPLADRHYFPAAQDAVEFNGEWLPFGADLSVFNPKPVEKRHAAAFLGMMYPKRAEYVSRIGYPLEILPPVCDPDTLRSFELLAETYSATRIFVNLPSYSRLLVTKVTEVMACGTMLVTPKVDHPSGAHNMSQFTNGKHLIYYDSDRPSDIGDIVKHYLRSPSQLDSIATAGLEEVARAHTLAQRLEKIIGDATSPTKR
jgi:hypothetical protein